MLHPFVALYRCFAATSFGGSIAGVVISEDDLPTALMQHVAADLAVPTTGFLTANDGLALGSARVRFFTPKQEIDACGYATLAVAAALVDRGVWEAGSSSGLDCRVLASGGEVPVRLQSAANGVLAEIEQRIVSSGQPRTSPGSIRAALDDLAPDPGLEPRVVGTGLRHLLVPAINAEALRRMALRADVLAELSAIEEVQTIGVFAVGRMRGSRLTVRLRDLCAAIGDIEEPASGTTSAAVAAYLAETLPRLSGNLQVEIEQGFEMGRPCRLSTRVVRAGSTVDAVLVQGLASAILTGQLNFAV